MGEINLKSSAFKPGGEIPSKYTCDGENINPLVEILGIPEGTKGLAFVVDDPDATSGGVWDHWLLWNIDPKTHYVPEDSVPAGAVQGKTSFGKEKYGGPCPPRGDKAHRYRFKVYALDALLDLSEGASKNELEEAMRDHILDEAELVGFYARK